MKCIAIDHLKTLPALWDHVYRQSEAEDVCLQLKDHDRVQPLKYKELNARAHCLAAYFMSKGMPVGARVLVLSDNSLQYVPYELAIQLAGGVNVTVGRTFSSAQLRHILQDTQPSYVLVADYATYAKHRAFLADQPAEVEILCPFDQYDDVQEGERLTKLAIAVELGKNYWREEQEAVAERKQGIRPDAVSTIVYPQTNEAEPKGVVLTHGNMLASLAAGANVLKKHLTREDGLISCLTPSYLLQRLWGLHLPVGLGLELLHVQHLHAMPAAIREQGSTLLLATPELLQCMHHSWGKRFSRGKLFGRKRWAKAQAVIEKVREAEAKGEKVGYWLKRKYKRAISRVARPFRRQSLGQLRYILCPGQGLPKGLEYFYQAAGVPIITGAGSEETSGLVSANSPDAHKAGSLGAPVAAVEVRNGHLVLAAGSALLAKGYWPEEPLAQDGYYDTGLKAEAPSGPVHA